MPSGVSYFFPFAGFSLVFRLWSRNSSLPQDVFGLVREAPVVYIKDNHKFLSKPFLKVILTIHHDIFGRACQHEDIHMFATGHLFCAKGSKHRYVSSKWCRKSLTANVFFSFPSWLAVPSALYANIAQVHWTSSLEFCRENQWALRHLVFVYYSDVELTLSCI